jgi:hypothetical protein
MNANTPLFRGALTVALFWIAAWAYLTFSDYRLEIERLDLSQYTLPDYLSDDCHRSKIDFSGESLKDRPPTYEELQSCLAIALNSHTQLVESSKDFALQHASKSFVFKGALPALGLLVIIAFWQSIAGTFMRISRAYLRWLRSGSSGKQDKNAEE